MNPSDLFTVAAGTAVVAGGLTAMTVAATKVYDAVTLRVFQRKTFYAKLNAYRQQKALSSLRHVQPDVNARGGWIVRPDGSIVNLDTRTVLDRDWRVQVIDPMMVRMDRLERLLLAGVGQRENGIQELLPDPAPLLPEFVTSDRVMDAAPSYRRLVLGQSEHGIVTADMASLVHVAVGGSSGWGKSVFLRWLCWQLIRSTDPVQLALIDLEGATLAPFASSDRVLWPLADTEQDAVAVMAELAGELDRRKELYAGYPGIDSMYAYNEVATEPLTPIVTIIDEATALLDNKRVEEHLRTLALRARKYGLWLILAGQDWKASSLDTAIRNQLGARMHFKAMSASQSRVLLGDAGAETIDVKGRAMALLPGREMMTIQTPMIRHSDIRGLRGNGPIHEAPIVESDDPPPFTDAQIEAAWDGLETQNKSALCRALGGEPTGGFFYKVDSAAKRLGLWL